MIAPRREHARDRSAGAGEPRATMRRAPARAPRSETALSLFGPHGEGYPRAAQDLHAADRCAARGMFFGLMVRPAAYASTGLRDTRARSFCTVAKLGRRPTVDRESAGSTPARAAESKMVRADLPVGRRGVGREACSKSPALCHGGAAAAREAHNLQDARSNRARDPNGNEGRMRQSSSRAAASASADSVESLAGLVVLDFHSENADTETLPKLPVGWVQAGGVTAGETAHLGGGIAADACVGSTHALGVRQPVGKQGRGNDALRGCNRSRDSRERPALAQGAGHGADSKSALHGFDPHPARSPHTGPARTRAHKGVQAGTRALGVNRCNANLRRCRGDRRERPPLSRASNPPRRPGAARAFLPSAHPRGERARLATFSRPDGRSLEAS